MLQIPSDMYPTKGRKTNHHNAVTFLSLVTAAISVFITAMTIVQDRGHYSNNSIVVTAEAITTLNPPPGYECDVGCPSQTETAFDIITTEGVGSPHVVTFHSGFALVGCSVEVGNKLPYTALTPAIHLFMTDGEFTTNNDYSLPGLSITINAGLAPNSIIHIRNVSFTATDITRTGATAATYNTIFKIMEGVVAPNISIRIIENKIFSQTIVAASDFGASIATGFMWVKGLSLVGGSSMVIANNTGRITTEGHGAHNINTNFIAYESCNCSFSGSSRLEISNNSISGLEAVTSLAQGNARFVYRHTCPWFISGNSFVLINGNTLPNITTINNNINPLNVNLIDDKIMQSMANLVFSMASSTWIDDSSAWLITNNKVGLSAIMQYPIKMGAERLAGKAEDLTQTFNGFVVLVSLTSSDMTVVNNAEFSVSSNDVVCTNVRSFGAERDSMTLEILFGETESSIVSIKSQKLSISKNSKFIVDNSSMFVQFEFISGSIMRAVTMIDATTTWVDGAVFSFSSNNITFDTRLNHNIQQRVFNLDGTTLAFSLGSRFVTSDCRLDMMAVDGVLAVNTAHLLIVGDTAITVSGSASTMLVERNYLLTNISAATDPQFINTTSIITIQLVGATTRSAITANDQGSVRINDNVLDSVGYAGVYCDNSSSAIAQVLVTFFEYCELNVQTGAIFEIRQNVITASTSAHNRAAGGVFYVQLSTVKVTNAGVLSISLNTANITSTSIEADAASSFSQFEHATLTISTNSIFELYANSLTAISKTGREIGSAGAIFLGLSNVTEVVVSETSLFGVSNNNLSATAVSGLEVLLAAVGNTPNSESFWSILSGSNFTFQKNIITYRSDGAAKNKTNMVGVYLAVNITIDGGSDVHFIDNSINAYARGWSDNRGDSNIAMSFATHSTDGDAPNITIAGKSSFLLSRNVVSLDAGQGNDAVLGFYSSEHIMYYVLGASTLGIWENTALFKISEYMDYGMYMTFFGANVRITIDIHNSSTMSFLRNNVTNLVQPSDFQDNSQIIVSFIFRASGDGMDVSTLLLTGVSSFVVGDNTFLGNSVCSNTATLSGLIQGTQSTLLEQSRLGFMGPDVRAATTLDSGSKMEISRNNLRLGSCNGRRETLIFMVAQITSQIFVKGGSSYVISENDFYASIRIPHPDTDGTPIFISLSGKLQIEGVASRVDFSRNKVFETSDATRLAGVQLGDINLAPEGGGGVLAIVQNSINLISMAHNESGVMGGVLMLGVACMPAKLVPNTTQCGIFLQGNKIIITTQQPPAPLVWFLNSVKWYWGAVGIAAKITIPTAPRFHPEVDVSNPPLPSDLAAPTIILHTNHFTLNSGSVTTSVIDCDSSGLCTPEVVSSEIIGAFVVTMKVGDTSAATTQEPYIVDAKDNTMLGNISFVIPRNKNNKQVGVGVVLVNYDTTIPSTSVIATVHDSTLNMIGFPADAASLVPPAIRMTALSTTGPFTATSYIKVQNCLGAYTLLDEPEVNTKNIELGGSVSIKCDGTLTTTHTGGTPSPSTTPSLIATLTHQATSTPKPTPTAPVSKTHSMMPTQTSQHTPTSTPPPTPSFYKTLTPQQRPSITTTRTPSPTFCGFGDDETLHPCSLFIGSTTALSTTTETTSISTTNTPPAKVGDCTVAAANRTTLVSVPHGVWSGGDEFSVFVRVGGALSSVVREEPVLGALAQDSPMMVDGGKDVSYRFAGPERVSAAEGYAHVRVRYGGQSTLSGRRVTVWVPLGDLFACPVKLAGGGPDVPLTLDLQEASIPPLAKPVASSVVAISAISSLLSGMPGGLVRAGMVSSLVTMMRCADFDPTEEIDNSNNPAMWAVGSEELQYFRASILIGALILASGVTLLIIGVYITIYSGAVYSVYGALRELRMPSMFLVVVLIASQVCQVTISTMLLHQRTEMKTTSAIAADYMMTGVVAIVIWGYILYFAYTCTFGMKVGIVELPPDGEEVAVSSGGGNSVLTVPLLSVEEPASVDTMDSSSDDTSDCSLSSSSKKHKKNSGCRQRPRRSLAFRMWVYLMEPTHGPEAMPLPDHHLHSSDDDEDEEMSDKNNNGQASSTTNDAASVETKRRNRQTAHLIASEEWLCGNYYFVADKKWAAFGAIEVIAGTLIDFSDGVPVTSTSLTWCLFPLGVTGLLLAILLFLLLWKRPIAVRLSQWNTTIVTALLLVATAMCAGNMVLAKPDLEKVILNVLVAVAIICGTMSMLDVVMWVLLLIPGLRVNMGLRDTTLGGLLREMRHKARNEEATRREEFAARHNRGSDPALPYLAAANDVDTTDPDAAAWHAMAVKVLVNRLRKGNLEAQKRADERNL